MNTRFAASLCTAACLAATLGSAQAEGLNLRHLADGPRLSQGTFVGYELSPGLDTAGGLIERRAVADEAVQANLNDSCERGLSLCPAMHRWLVLAPADVADARLALAETAMHTHLPGATGVQFALSPQVALRVEFQQYPRENALDLKPTVGEVALGLKVAF